MDWLGNAYPILHLQIVLELIKSTIFYSLKGHHLVFDLWTWDSWKNQAIKETTKGSLENSDSHWLHLFRLFSTRNSKKKLWSQSYGLLILVILSHLYASLWETEFQFQDTN